MNDSDRIQTKVGTIFQIADLYLLGRLPLEVAKEHIHNEMVNIRPAQYEAFKDKLEEKMKKVDSNEELKKLLHLFVNYLPYPYEKLEEGHPLRNYLEENEGVRRCLIKVDKMEGKNATVNAWRHTYQLLNKYQIHIKRMEKNFYPLMIPMGMKVQVEKARELGKEIINKMAESQKLLDNGDMLNFLLNQRKLILGFMNFLMLEEKVLIPKAISVLTEQDIIELRRLDDMEGYVYIERPKDFVPMQKNKTLQMKVRIDTMGKEKEKDYNILQLLFPALLQAKKISLIYFSLTGEVIYTMGDQIEEADLHLLEKTKELLLTENESHKESYINQENHIYLITYTLVKDNQGKPQGVLKIKEDISHLKKHVLQEKSIRIADDIKIIDANQNFSELFNMYPKLQDDLFKLNEDLTGLKSHLGMQLLKKSTIGMLAKSLCIDDEELINGIKQLIESY